MQAENKPKLRGERTGWRDVNLSERHRKWGLAVPAVDLDFLLLEYDKGMPSALIEYKMELAPAQFPSHPSYRALSALGDRAALPVFVVRYAQNFSWWKIIPLNDAARKILPERSEVNEFTYVAWLHNIRGLPTPKDLFRLMEFAL